MSDEDVPLSVTKANLVAENSKDGVTIQPVLSETDVVTDIESTTKPTQNDIDTLSKNDLSNEEKKVEPDEESINCKQTETVLVSKKKSRISKEQPPKKTNRTKKQSKSLEPIKDVEEPIKDVDLNSKPSFIENEQNILVNSTVSEDNSISIQNLNTNVKEANDSIPVECKLLQNRNEDKSIEETPISIENQSPIDDKKSTVENTETVSASSQVKKKRKRRKNELAAIVADQLLESFKEVDKSRIDDLKMLENLAYEKSEDLLLTGEYFMIETAKLILA